LALLFSIENGESIPNTQMALYTIPITAKIIEPYDPRLAQEMQRYAQSLQDPTIAGLYFIIALPSFYYLLNNLNSIWWKMVR
jgi:hypothetical protein